MTRRQPQSVFVPGRRGWEGQQGSLAGVGILVAILAVAVAAGALVWLFDPAPAMKATGVVALLTLGLGIWLLLVQIRVERVRVVRIDIGEGIARFSGAAEVRRVLRLLGVCGIALLATWVWMISTVTSTNVPVLTLLLVPVVAVLLIYGGVRAWVGADGAHVLTLRPDGVTLKVPRNNLSAPWDEVGGARLVGNRVEVSVAGGGGVSFAARDFASDPIILAELLTFYARTPHARADIGDGTLALLRDGAF
ncbi:MAG: hypothetical protein J0I43_07175 [Microbacterium sp.]|uniref:hypothetical protein n=1 Tax=Microbacterium sp. TaxID=51671 RepID=UPI001AD1D4B3|nr:hypothetical protein [Microbacterium sp.]MBN9177135.1 hypothetical protein [Microbacterium sp.]